MEHKLHVFQSTMDKENPRLTSWSLGNTRPMNHLNPTCLHTACLPNLIFLSVEITRPPLLFKQSRTAVGTELVGWSGWKRKTGQGRILPGWPARAQGQVLCWDLSSGAEILGQHSPTLRAGCSLHSCLERNVPSGKASQLVKLNWKQPCGVLGHFWTAGYFTEDGRYQTGAVGRGRAEPGWTKRRWRKKLPWYSRAGPSPLHRMVAISISQRP